MTRSLPTERIDDRRLRCELLAGDRSDNGRGQRPHPRAPAHPGAPRAKHDERCVTLASPGASRIDVENETFEPGAIWLEGFGDRIGDRSEFIATKTRRHQDDAAVPGIRRDSFVGELDEIGNVRGDDRAPFASRVVELGAVVQLGVGDVLGAGCVHAAPPKDLGDVRGQVLVEVDLHRVKRTRPGYCFSIASGVRAAFASILA